jgi:spermidine synthase
LSATQPLVFDPSIVRMPHLLDDADVGGALEAACRQETPQPYIMENAIVRQLHFTQAATQSAMLIDDPYALIVDYARKMMSFLLFNADPKYILMIGLGGGSLAKFCYRHLPQAKITVVEINGEVIAMRDKFFVPQNDDRFSVVHDDGANFIERLEESVDVMLVDAFDADGIAPSLADSNFFPRAAKQLTPKGIFVMNLLGEGGGYVENIRAIRTAFKRNILLVPVMSGENVLLFAFKRPPPQSISRKLEGVARRLQSQLELDFPRYLQRICQGHRLLRAKIEPK